MDFMLSIDDRQLKTAPIIIGSLVAHIYNPHNELWIAAYGNSTSNGKILWRINEIGLVLRADVWGDSNNQDILISVMISTGIGYCFGRFVNMI